MIQKLIEWFFTWVDRYVHAKYGDKKRELLKNHPGTIVEIGAGYGANFRYLKPGTKVIAIEPNKAFNKLLKKRANSFGIKIDIYNQGAESIPFLDNESVEMVFGSLVLCTVQNPAQSLSEIKRILKTGGRFAFIEHVEAEHHSLICKVQNFVKVPWKWFFDGCHVTRNTGFIIKNMFDKTSLKPFKSKSIFVPVIPHIYGVAVK